MVEKALAGALRADGIETTLAGWTPLGHLELLRRRSRRPLATVLAGARA
jgi:Ribonuclease G/E